MSMSAISSAVYQVPAQRTIPRVEPKNVADLPAAEQEEIRARRAVSQTRMEEGLRRLANAESQRIADAKGHDVHYRSAPNIISLTREQALHQIEFMSELIQSGEADKTPLNAARGTQTTSNYRQYVYWAQQHVKELDAAGQSAPEQAETGTAGGPFPADYVSEIKRLRTDVPGVNYEDWSPEFKARVAEGRRRSEALSALGRELEERAKIQTVEVNDRHAPNVATLTKDQALKQIAYMTDLIQSGEAEKTTLFTGYGDKTTSNYRQYVYWLQQHVKELDAGQSVPAQADAGTLSESVSANYRAVDPKFMRKYEDLSPEEKAEIAEDHRRSEEGLRIAKEMEARSKLQSFENNDRIAPNVAGLNKDQALKQIAYMSELIQSGEAEKTKLWTGYGDKTTNNYRQYVYWLQQHVKELEATPQSTLAQA